MFAIRIFNRKDNRTQEFKRTIGTISEHIMGKLNKSAKVIEDDDSVELSSGDLNYGDENTIVAELLIKKTIVINNDDFNDSSKLDQFLHEIKNFCEQAKKIEDLEYLPLHLREKNTS